LRLPNVEHASVAQAKILDYLLSPSHSGGRSKAGFFRKFGFERRSWRVLKDALVRHGREHQVAHVEASLFGTRYIIDGRIMSPDGRNRQIRSVWFTESEADPPRFVTAYPLPRSRA